MKTPTYKPLYILFGVVILAQMIIGYTAYVSFESWELRGMFGDMFGAVNALFSGLAFAGVIYAILLQSKELELQREELKLTRQELTKSASAQSDQVVLMKESAEQNAISSALNAHCQIAASSGQGSTTQIKSTEARNKLLTMLDDIIEK